MKANTFVGLELNPRRIKCMSMSRHQNAAQVIMKRLQINPLKLWQNELMWQRK